MPQGRLELRDYQRETMEQARSLLRQDPSLLVTAPTGSGKTVILAEIGAQTLAGNRRAGLLVHRQELVQQSRDLILLQSGQEPGIVWKDRREWDQPFTIIAQDSVSHREIPPDFPRLDLLMVDEAHHTVAPGWLRTIRRLNPRYLLGFSATPFRQDKEPLCPDPFARVIRPITPHELIEQGLLCPAVIESPIVHDHNGELQPVNQASNLENVYLQAVRYAIAQGRSKILLYVSSTREYTPSQVVRRTTGVLRRSGVAAGAIAEGLPAGRRRATLARFRAAAGVSVLVNYLTLTEGTDLPLVDCVIIGRRTASESTIIQMIGRGLRKHPGKRDCLVLDYTGRPDMDGIIHYWRLDGAKEDKKRKASGLSREELRELAADFPKRLSPLDGARARYPWLSPFDGRPLHRARARSGREGPPGYVTVEPAAGGGWKVSTVTLESSGPAPLRRQQTLAATAEDAAVLVRRTLGEAAPRLERSAPWRLGPASEAQKSAWRRLHPGAPSGADRLTSGEVSDAIAQERFQRRVDPRLL